MKVRTGFVSNSSSSSFIVIYSKVDRLEDFRNDNRLMIRSTNYISDGKVYTQATKELVNYFIANRLDPNPDWGRYSFVLEYYRFPYYLELAPEDLEALKNLPSDKHLYINPIEVDNYQPSSLDEFIYYLDLKMED